MIEKAHVEKKTFFACLHNDMLCESTTWCMKAIVVWHIWPNSLEQLKRCVEQQLPVALPC